MSYTGKEINRAGDAFLNNSILRDEALLNSTMEVVSYWRFCHEPALVIAFEKLQRVALAKDKKAIFAKRLKRANSIALKLRRFRDQKMKLRNMQDIGGCRAIVSTEKKIDQVVRELKKMPEFKWSDRKFRIKNYIKSPKPDGYRSVHIVGKFPDKEGSQRRIEVQLRTFIQHYWATTLEIVDLYTDQALKSNQGYQEWKTFFKITAEHFAIMDGIHMFDTLTIDNKIDRYITALTKNEKLLESSKKLQWVCKSLDVRSRLVAFAASLQNVDARLEETKTSGYVLLEIDLSQKKVESTVFEANESEQAEAKYSVKEKQSAGNNSIVVALVSSTDVGGIREAYPNYFADSTKFINHLDLVLSV